MVRYRLPRSSSAFLLWLFLAASCSAAWDVTSLGEGFASDMKIDSLGSPHLAVLTSSGLEYRTLVGGSFVTQETIALSYSFALDVNDRPHFVAKTGAGYSPELLYRDDLGTQQQIAITNHLVGTLKLIGFDSQNRPHVAYNNPSEQKLIHSRWDGVSWTPRVVATGPNFQYGNSGFTATIDSNDRAHFLWDDTSDQLQYAKPTISGWNTEPLFTGQNSSPYNLEIDHNGDFHFANNVFTGSGLTGGLFYATNEGGVSRNERIPVAKSFGASRAKLVIDDDNRLSIFSYDSAFLGPVDLVHYQLTMDGWESTIIDTHPNPQFSGPDQIQAAHGGGRHHVLFSTGDSNILYAVQAIPEPTTGFLLVAALVVLSQTKYRRMR